MSSTTETKLKKKREQKTATKEEGTDASTKLPPAKKRKLQNAEEKLKAEVEALDILLETCTDTKLQAYIAKEMLTSMCAALAEAKGALEAVRLTYTSDSADTEFEGSLQEAIDMKNTLLTKKKNLSAYIDAAKLIAGVAAKPQAKTPEPQKAGDEKVVGDKAGDDETVKTCGKDGKSGKGGKSGKAKK